RISREPEHRRTLIRLLRPGAAAHGHPAAAQMAKIRSDREILILDVVELPWTERAGPAPHPMRPGVGTDHKRGLLLRDAPSIQEIGQPLANHRGMQDTRLTAEFHPERVELVVLLLKFV